MDTDLRKIERTFVKVVATAAIAGALAAVFSRCTSEISEKEAFCVQSDPTSFQIIDIHDQDKPRLLWDVVGDFDHSNGIENRKLVKAFVNRGLYEGDPYYAAAEMDLEKRTCKISYWASDVWPITSKNQYKLVDIN